MVERRGFSAAERQRICHELSQKLGPEYISYRPQGGGQVQYIDGHRAIQFANEIFGFDGWSFEIRERRIEHQKPLCCSALVRVTLADGSFREDVGYGVSRTATVPNIAVEMEKLGKEAVTDALKRSLRLFGDALGNCLSDKTYNNEIRSVRAEREVIDLNNLRRPKRQRRESQQPKPANTPATPTPRPASRQKSEVRRETTLDSDYDIGLEPVRAAADAMEIPDSPPPAPEQPDSSIATPGVIISGAQYDSAISTNSPVISDARFDPAAPSPLAKPSLPQNESKKVVMPRS